MIEETTHHETPLPAPAKGAKLPVHVGPHAAGEGDPSAAANAKALADNKSLHPAQLSADQVATPPTSPPHVGGKQVEVLMGPYRGTNLIMPEAEAENAINDHWAIEPVSTLVGAPDPDAHPPLTDDERTHALEAAQAWADKVNAPPDPPDPPPEGTPTATKATAPPPPKNKAMSADQPAPYTTKTV